MKRKKRGVEMKMEKNFAVKRVIESKSFGYGVSAYKDTVYVDDEVFSSYEGIAKDSCLNPKKLEKIKYAYYYYLIPTNGLELWRTGYIELSELIIKNPYSNFPTSNDAVAVQYNSYNGQLFALDGSVFPKAIYMGYMSGNIHNGYYNLDKLYDYLSKDPEQFKDVKRKRIPYYNAEKGMTEELAFIWTPDKKTYEEYYKRTNGSDLGRLNLVKYLGLDKYKEKNPEYEE